MLCEERGGVNNRGVAKKRVLAGRKREMEIVNGFGGAVMGGLQKSWV